MAGRRELAALLVCVLVLCPGYALGKEEDGLRIAPSPTSLAKTLEGHIEVDHDVLGLGAKSSGPATDKDTPRATPPALRGGAVDCGAHKDCVACVQGGAKCMFVASPGKGPQCVPYAAATSTDDLSNAWSFNTRRALVNQHSVLRYPDDRFARGAPMLDTPQGLCQVFTDQLSLISGRRPIRAETIDCSGENVWRLNLDNRDDAWFRCATRKRVQADSRFSLDIVEIDRRTMFWHGTKDPHADPAELIYKKEDAPGWLGARSTAERYSHAGRVRHAFVASKASNPLRLLELNNLSTLKWFIHQMIPEIEALPEEDTDQEDDLSMYQAVISSFTGSFFGSFAPFKAFRAVFEKVWHDRDGTLNILRNWPDEYYSREGQRHQIPSIARMSEYSSDGEMAKMLCRYLAENEETLGKIHGYANGVIMQWKKNDKTGKYDAIEGLHSEIMVCDAKSMVEQRRVKKNVVKVDNEKINVDVPNISGA